jgi:DNA-binding transcriptional LysR family regulator
MNEIVEIDPRTRLHANSGDAVQDWAIAGLGVMLKSDVDVAADIASGRLVHILSDWRSAPAPIYALMPSRRHTPSKTRAFIEALSARLAGQ